ncbi:retrovirus-related Pol polyprotein from type-1 retrotransposable element R2 [Syngnathus typhle]
MEVEDEADTNLSAPGRDVVRAPEQILVHLPRLDLDCPMCGVRCDEMGDGSADEGVACDLCERCFRTAVGMSQHKRHVHAGEWFGSERRRSRMSGVPNATKLWSVAEVERLKVLMEEHGGNRKRNEIVATLMDTGKTKEQVRSKWKALRGDSTGRLSGERRRALAVRALPPRRSPPPTLPDLVENRVLEVLGMGDEDQRATADIIREASQKPDLIESSAIDVMTALGGKVGWPERPAGSGIRSRNMRGWERRLVLKKTVFYHQKKGYSEGTKGLARRVLDGLTPLRCDLPQALVYEKFCDKWETRRPFHGLGDFHVGFIADNEPFYHPIHAAEVVSNLAKMGKNSAPGLDKIRRQAVKNWDPEGKQLARLFTTWMVRGVVPRAFKECKTRLLPKSTDPSELGTVAGWRPVTIGSVVLRLFGRIMAMRLARACPVSPRQRGFVADASGCQEKLMILDRIMGHSRLVGEPLAVVFIDFAKAFDSVSHDHILCVLGQLGVDKRAIELIRQSYVDCSTRVGCGGTYTKPILMKVGVKQGDPMSPLLFNLAMDPLIHGLERNGCHFHWGDRRIATLAFADDLVLVSCSKEGMWKNLGILEDFCQLTGLAVQPRKCHGVWMGLEDEGREAWALCGQQIHMVTPGESVRYLGADIVPWQGIVSPDVTGQVDDWLRKISRASLKPSQKVKICNSFLLARLAFRMDVGKVPVTRMRLVDGKVRMAVKRWLRLDPSTGGGIFYSRARDGGLGIRKLSVTIPRIQIRRTWKLCWSSDIWLRSLATEAVQKPAWAKLWVAAGGEPDGVPTLGTGGAVPDEVASVPVLPDLRRAENLAWEALRVQGVGVDLFRNDVISNTWIAEPLAVRFRQRHYLIALALRAGVYPTREFHARGRTGVEATCRRCNVGLETCSHILGQCASVKRSRIQRHNKICELVTTEAERWGWRVTKELRVTAPGVGVRIPDLVLKKEEKVLILDVTIPYEGIHTLQRAAAEKVARYKPIRQQVLEAVGGNEVEVMGFPVGARGKWPRQNFEVLRKLGIPGGGGPEQRSLIRPRRQLQDIHVVILHKEEGAGLGFSIAGGCDRESKALTVHKVFPNGLANQEGTIQKGDEVLSINGQTLRGVTHADATAALRQARTLELAVVAVRKTAEEQSEESSCAMEEPGTLLSVELKKGGGGVGFTLEGGRGSIHGDRPLVVNRIFKGGAAEQSNLQCGDDVLQVQGTSLHDMTRFEAWNMIKALPDGSITVDIRRRHSH